MSTPRSPQALGKVKIVALSLPVENCGVGGFCSLRVSRLLLVDIRLTWE